MNRLSWEQRVPICKNRLIMKQLGLAIGIPFGALTVFLLFMKAYNGLLLIGAAFVLALLLVLLIFKGTYDVQYVLDEKGVLCQTQSSQRKRVQQLSAVTFLFGLIKGNFTAAGAGLLSGASTKIRIPWKRIRKVKFFDNQTTILIHGGFGENIALFCSKENYFEVVQYVQNREEMHKIKNC